MIIIIVIIIIIAYGVHSNATPMVMAMNSVAFSAIVGVV